MLNVDIDGRLVNGLVGRVTEFKYLNNSASVVYMKLNDDMAGLVERQLDVTAQQHNCVTIKKCETLFGLRRTGNSYLLKEHSLL